MRKKVNKNLEENSLSLTKEDKSLKKQNKRAVKRTSISNGLSTNEVNDRVEKGLTNFTSNRTSKTKKEIFKSNILTIFNLLNLSIAVWLITVNSFKNLTFMSVIIINTIIGIFQELKAKRTIEKLSLISAPVVEVLRDGEIKNISSDNMVIDDVVYLTLGKQICADSVVSSGTIEVNESLLTGESDAVVKEPGSVLYSGSFVVSGECYAQVTKVGEDNYIQKLVLQAKKYRKPKSEIMNSLKMLIKIVTIIVVLVGAALFINQYVIQKHDYVSSVIGTAGGIIGMIPSGLFLLTSLSLAYGVIKLGSYNTLVQDLYCIEMLARVNVLCLDKTGTITDGTMKVKDVVEFENNTGLTTKQIISLLQGSFKENNATAIALQKRFGKNSKTKPTATIPFSSARKYSAANYKELNLSFIMGAPEFIFKERYNEICDEVEKYAELGYRVLFLASSTESIENNQQAMNEKQMTPLALICIEDTIRKDAIETINYFKQSGVDVRVISGDNPLTVSKIAKRAGIENANKYVSLDGKTDDELELLVNEYTVFGRVSPSQKRVLVKLLKKKRNVVAMTGDGVNDILALKEADCSIAMANGSEAARNVSHLVLLDSNFSSMPQVVKEGRRVINNIQRVATLYLTKTIFSFLISVLVIVLHYPYPIQTIQLMFFDFLVIGVPSLYLAVEPNNNQVRGRFLLNILTSALPGGLLVVFNYLVLIVVGKYLNLSYAEISTSTVFITTYVGLLVLYRVCKPFNAGRRLLFISMCIIFAGALVLFNGFFDMIMLGVPNILLVVVICQYSLVLLPLLIKASTKLRKVIYKYIS